MYVEIKPTNGYKSQIMNITPDQYKILRTISMPNPTVINSSGTVLLCPTTLIKVISDREGVTTNG